MQFSDFHFEPGKIAFIDDEVVRIAQAVFTGWLGVDNGFNLLA